MGLLGKTRCNSDSIYSDIYKLSKCVDKAKGDVISLLMLMKGAGKASKIMGNLSPLLNTVGLALTRFTSSATSAYALYLKDVDEDMAPASIRLGVTLIAPTKLISALINNRVELKRNILNYLYDLLTCEELTQLGQIFRESVAPKTMVLDYIRKAMTLRSCNEARIEGMRTLNWYIGKKLLDLNDIYKVIKDVNLKIVLVRANNAVRDVRVLVDNEDYTAILHDLAVKVYRELVPSVN